MSIDIETVQALAELSECTRRKYGAVIIGSNGILLSEGWNARITNCCNGTCVRDRLGFAHGENTDSGGEVHAEQAALINMDWLADNPEAIYVAGIGPEGPYNGFENRPCYSCARMIKYAGIDKVFMPFDDEWQSVHINDILENWERSWEGV